MSTTVLINTLISRCGISVECRRAMALQTSAVLGSTGSIMFNPRIHSGFVLMIFVFALSVHSTYRIGGTNIGYTNITVGPPLSHCSDVSVLTARPLDSLRLGRQ
jgi:hypothetical protein